MPHSYLVSLESLRARNYDLSAKTPSVKEEKALREVGEVLQSLKYNQKEADKLLKELELEIS